MKQDRGGKEKADRHCWDCRRRRLECDRTTPSCKKCQKANRKCTGYNDQKPLQWVTTGHVSLRPKDKDHPYKIYHAIPSGRQTSQLAPVRAEITQSNISVASSPPFNSGSIHELPLASGQSPYSIMDQPTLGYLSEVELQVIHDILKNIPSFRPSPLLFEPNARSERHTDEQQAEEACQKVAGIISSAMQATNAFPEFGNKAEIGSIRATESEKNPAAMLPSSTDLLLKLQHALRHILSRHLPLHNYLSEETSEIVQAVSYYNVRMYPDMTAFGELVPNPANHIIPIRIMNLLPPAMHHTFICISLNYFIYTLPVGTDRAIVAATKSKIYHHRGAAIRALNNYVADERTRLSDLTIASILLFMTMELQDSASADWRTHAVGMQRLLDMRGGTMKVLKQAPPLGVTIVFYQLVVMLSNTVSPAWDQIHISGAPEQVLNDIQSIYTLIFPYILCPPELFFNMIQISQLRSRAASSLCSAEHDDSQVREAYEILSHIESFAPQQWAQDIHHDEWMLVGNIWRASMTIYCIMSLQSHMVLPTTPEIETLRAQQGDQLLKSLQTAIRTRMIARFILWPMIMAGVESAYRSQSSRDWIGERLRDLSRIMGTSSPLKARAVLMRYWENRVPDWEQCFDRPYMFVV